MVIPGWTQIVDLLRLALQTINHLVGGDPGLAIIIFTLLVKLVTLPLTLKSIKSMRETQRIQPLLKELNKRYKDDKTKLQAETMKLYQEHGVNPMGSCLPMLIQLPIFFALYQALAGLVGLPGYTGHIDPDFGKAFLWVPNLAQKDPMFIWPVLSGAFQFLGNRMSQPYGSNKNVDSQQAMMNKIMQFMPIYLIVIYLNFAAGAVIYWTFSAVFSAVQTYFINGFGSLPDVPGFHWLPKRPLPAPTPQILEEVAKIDAQADAETRRGKRAPATVTATATAGATRALTPPAPAVVMRPRPANGASDGRPKGFMAKMMEQALAAQEAQEAARREAQARNGDPYAFNSDAPTTDGDDDSAQPQDGVLTGRLAPTDGNGTAEIADGPAASTLPRKRRSKR